MIKESRFGYGGGFGGEAASGFSNAAALNDTNVTSTTDDSTVTTQGFGNNCGGNQDTSYGGDNGCCSGGNGGNQDASYDNYNSGCCYSQGRGGDYGSYGDTGYGYFAVRA